MVLIDPVYPESQAIAEHIAAVEVEYIDDNDTLQRGIIEIHQSVAEDITAFFQTAFRLRFPLHKIAVSSDYQWDDGMLTKGNVTSGFNYRFIKSTSRLSLHSYGLAFDVNPRLNPYIGFKNGRTTTDPLGALYNTEVPGTLTPDHPLVTLMKSLGWEWGGDWTPESGRIDYQHFQKPTQSVIEITKMNSKEES